jgi:hypothetical protein
MFPDETKDYPFMSEFDFYKNKQTYVYRLSLDSKIRKLFLYDPNTNRIRNLLQEQTEPGLWKTVLEGMKCPQDWKGQHLFTVESLREYLYWNQREVYRK